MLVMLGSVVLAALLPAATCASMLQQQQQQQQQHLRGAAETGPAVRLAGFGPTPAEELGNLHWLHIPKTGTSFIASIWAFACSNGKVLDLSVSANATPGCGACYDFALMDRYPRAEYCRPGALGPRFQTQHMPWTGDLATANVVGFFRRPNQRVISAMKDHFHANGMSSDRYHDMVSTCAVSRSEQAACFAKYPGIAGCSTRMLTGDTCAVDPVRGQDMSAKDKVDDAISQMKKMKFVGLTEEWDESVCLFHLIFGGMLHRQEFKNEHHGINPEDDYDESQLEGFVDEADELVYQAAKERFQELRVQYAPGQDSACDLIFGASNAEDLRTTDCRKLGVECGEVDHDGDCGLCPALKSRFLESRRDWSSPYADDHRPTCTADHRCAVDGELHPDIFGW